MRLPRHALRGRSWLNCGRSPGRSCTRSITRSTSSPPSSSSTTPRTTSVPSSTCPAAKRVIGIYHNTAPDTELRAAVADLTRLLGELRLGEVGRPVMEALGRLLALLG
ncbi:hypothetical protein EZV63_28525 [Streptomyces sp. VN1]|nr:hypothetical protein EZV63_28525 [Streptomyces sp. VN1]